ncbi:hypothetical protein BDV93DRAFT_523323 [Ceratobasidium sp. AG-I]|nr:hypothetical protein BDV93DRAFT_523323 [Ceratobasidium sp. AG-I]
MPATSLSFTPPVSTISASELARDKSRFELWAVAVNLNLHEKGLPKELRDLEETSLIFPTWLKADENTRSFPGFETLITELREATSGAPDLKYQDNDTNSDLHRALPSILETCHHLRMLCEDQYGLHYNEADFRWSIDHLMHFVWKFLGKGMMKIFLERVLALPTASGVPFSCATSTADSVTCINLGMKPLEAITYDIKCIYSCSPGPTNSLLLPHCIIQFKAPGIAGNVPERQVLFGMVSALHQRRALGFSEQFVFGISHEEASTVHVYAARWEHLRADPQAERSLQPSGPLNPSADASQHPVNNKNTQSLNARQEIRKYLFTSFDLRKPDEAVRFSLLMGATMSLAKNYKDAISLRSVGLLLCRHALGRPIATHKPPPRVRAASDREVGRGRTTVSCQWNSTATLALPRTDFLLLNLIKTMSYPRVSG